jgi:hypothetical protein
MIRTLPMMVRMSLLKMRKRQLVTLLVQIKLSFLSSMDNVGRSYENPNSNAPMEKTLTRLGLIMHEIIEKCKQGGVVFYDHVTSHMKVLASDI